MNRREGGGRLLWWAIAAGWLCFGVVAATMEYVTRDPAEAVAWGRFLAFDVLAAVLWIPLTVGIVEIARRWPLWPLRPASLGVHAVAAVSASFVLNAAYFPLAAAFGMVSGTPGELAAAAAATAFRFLHLNAGATIVIAIIATLWFRDPAGGAAESVEPTVSVRVGSAIRLVPASAIDWIEGAGDYARLHLGEETLLASDRLGALERRLAPAGFLRVHRSTIVNVRRVAALRLRSPGAYDLELHDGTRLRVSRPRGPRIRALFQSGDASEAPA